jgi:hypothetical protein
MDNIRDKSILEAANSPFFKAIRREFPYNQEGNLKRPCMIIDNPEVLRKVVQNHLAPEGHEHSEDIIRDPEVVAWVDDYARRFKNLVDPIWLEMIQDPNYRWYREGADYRNLFRFNPALPATAADTRPASDGNGARERKQEKQTLHAAG